MIFCCREDFPRWRAASDFDGRHAGDSVLQIRQPRLGIRNGIFDEIDWQIDGEISGKLLHHVQQHDFTGRIQKRCGFSQNAFALFRRTQIDRHQNFLVHAALPVMSVPRGPIERCEAALIKVKNFRRHCQQIRNDQSPNGALH